MIGRNAKMLTGKCPQVEIIELKEERNLYLSILKEFANEYNSMASYPAITKQEIANRLNPIAKKIFETLDRLERSNV